MKQVIQIFKAPPRHWVGDGFPVHSMFSYDREPERFSPFLLLDYAAPTAFSPQPPGAPSRGVGAHPHRGFETVTIVFAGEVAHRDSTGNGGIIGAGDVQWMTAGSGIVHEEFHAENFSRSGGGFHMAQLWVNLPAKDKMTAPCYQGIGAAAISVVEMADGGKVRVIAGEFNGHRGPAHTHTPINVWEVNIGAGKSLELAQPDGWTTLLLVTGGSVRVNGSEAITAAQLVMLSREGTQLRIDAQSDAAMLLLAGEPIAEPVVGYGPFVMNNQQQIVQAFNDYNSGRFGSMD
ncbi:MAG: pirin family protein [Burkholderiales bacterium]